MTDKFSRLEHHLRESFLFERAYAISRNKDVVPVVLEEGEMYRFDSSNYTIKMMHSEDHQESLEVFAGDETFLRASSDPLPSDSFKPKISVAGLDFTIQSYIPGPWEQGIQRDYKALGRLCKIDFSIS